MKLKITKNILREVCDAAKTEFLEKSIPVEMASDETQAYLFLKGIERALQKKGIDVMDFTEINPDREYEPLDNL